MSVTSSPTLQEAAFSGSHDNTIEWVASGRAEVGALSYKTFDKRVKEGKVDPTKVKIIWTTPTYADYNWTAHPDLETAFGEGFTDKLQKTLISVKDPALLDAFNRSELISAKNEDFDAIALWVLRIASALSEFSVRAFIVWVRIFYQPVHQKIPVSV